MTDAGDAKKDYTFGQIVIKENLCSFTQVKEALDVQNKLRSLGLEPKKLGDILIEKGYITADQAAYATKLQAQARGTSLGLALPGLQILSKIGQGGMGAVYKARQVSLDRIVAVKVLASKFSSDSSFVDRFVREARSVARLNHENIIAGIDVGEAGGVHYLVMEYVEGIPVSAILKRDGRIEERRCLEIGLQMARALAHAQKNGIIHRDVKPENIMIAPGGTAKLCDLGLAKRVKEDVGITVEGTSVGTPNYISPEQAQGAEDVDCRADIYSLGASLYHMGAGSPPFAGDTALALMTQHVTAPVEPPRMRNPALSEGFSRMVLRMMEKRREDRYQTPEAVAAEIERLLRGEPAPTGFATRGRADTPRPRITRRMSLPSRSSMTGVPALIVAAVLVVAGAVAMVLFVGGPSQDAAKNDDGEAETKWNPPPPKADSGAGRETGAVEEDIEAFRKLSDDHIRDLSVKGRFAQPYKTILDRIAACERDGAFVAQRAWEAEKLAYKSRANALIGQCVWGDIDKKISDHFSAGRYAQALEEANRLEDDYRWFWRGEPSEKTEAGTAHERWVAKITQALQEVYVEQKNLAERMFRDAAQRDEAYRLLDALAVSATPEQQVEIAKTRGRYVDAEMHDRVAGAITMEKWEEAGTRIDALQKLVGADAAAKRQLEGWRVKLADLQVKLVGDLRAEAARAYTAARSGVLKDALQKRDYAAARRVLWGLLFKKQPGAIASELLPRSSDRGTLQEYLDPARPEPFETKRAVKAAEEGATVADAEGLGEAAQSVLLDIRDLALQEDMIGQVLEGVRQANRTPEKFQYGFSDVLKDAVRVEVPLAKPGDAVSLKVTREQGGGTAVLPVLVAPRGSVCLSEGDIVALARRSYGPDSARGARAEADPLFAMKVFLLYYRAGQLPAAKGWLEKVPVGAIGLDRYLAEFKGQASERDEADARKAFEEAQDLSGRKKDEARADKKFQECVEKYYATEHMKGRAPGSQKTRLEVARAWLQRGTGGETVLPDPGGGEGKPLAPGLEFFCYEGTWKELPDFSRLIPYKTGVAGDFDPSVSGREENFAIWYSGYLRVVVGGTYTFTLASDDGSRLRIGTQEIVENDYEHALREKTGTVDLTPGFHSITLGFFQGGKEKDLRVMWEGPQTPKKPLPLQALYHLNGSAER